MDVADVEMVLPASPRVSRLPLLMHAILCMKYCMYVGHAKEGGRWRQFRCETSPTKWPR